MQAFHQQQVEAAQRAAAMAAAAGLGRYLPRHACRWRTADVHPSAGANGHKIFTF